MVRSGKSSWRQQRIRRLNIRWLRICAPLSNKRQKEKNLHSFSFLYRPAIVVLLMSMVNEKQPFVLRCAVLYCFQSFLYKNELGQSQIIQTLLPTAADGEHSVTVGSLCA